MACLMTNRQALMEMIVMLGPDFTLQDDQGRTALMFAVEVNSSTLSHSHTHMHG
jgi:ankyrin repeat protein